MASGGTISLSGGTTMTTVVAGTDVFEDDDFNKPNQNNERLLGTATPQTLGTYSESNTYGWGQGGTGVANAAVSANVLVNGASGAFKELQDDVQAACAFLGQAVRAGVGTDVTTSTTITAATWNNLMLNIEDCWVNRFSPASLTTTTDGSTPTFTGTWTNTLTCTSTWTFGSANDCRAFFNGGGQLGLSISYSNNAGTQNDTWETRFATLGDIFITHNTTTAGAGTNAGLGFYELTTSNQQLLIYYGAAAPYSNAYFRVYARVNSTTNPTVIYFVTEFVDQGDNVVDASVEVDITVNARRRQPDANGSGFVFSVPVDAPGTITGS